MPTAPFSWQRSLLRDLREQAVLAAAAAHCRARCAKAHQHHRPSCRLRNRRGRTRRRDQDSVRIALLAEIDPSPTDIAEVEQIHNGLATTFTATKVDADDLFAEERC